MGTSRGPVRGCCSCQTNAEHRTVCEAIVKGTQAKAKMTAERHVLRGRERRLRNIGSATPLAGL